MNNVHFAIPEIYGETLSYYELLRKLVDKTNGLIENYNTVPDQIAEAVANLDASQLFSAVLNQLIHSIATDNTKSTNAVKVYKKHDLLYATFNETVNLYESIIDFTPGTETELIIGTNIREVNISELFIELRKLIEDEAQARTEADNELKTKIDNEKQERTEADNELKTNIDNEKQARTEEDNELKTNIDNEKQARTEADNELKTNIDNEKQKREQGDQRLETIINNGTIKVDKLWTNARPRSEFTPQNIPLDLSNYKFVYASFNDSTTNAKNVINKLLINEVDKSEIAFLYLKSNITYSRGFTISNSGVYFGEERSNSNDGPIENTHLIPTHIYGIK